MQSIRFERVTKEYPGAMQPAVAGCSLTVEQGALVVLMGPSGSGKTTLLKMANRLVEPTSGNIFIDAIEIHQFEPTALRRRIGYVIQQIGLFPHMKVGQNIAIVPELLGWEPARIEKRVDELLELVALSPQEYCNRYPAQLSGGQQQRVGLARALAADPDLLLMDEPFGALDAITRRDLQEELLHLQHKLHKTILFVTHDVEEALRLADKIVVMRAGCILQEGKPLDLLTRPRDRFVYDLMGAEDVVRRLSLVPVTSLLGKEDRSQALIPENGARIEAQENLRSALSILLRTGASGLTVVRDGKKVGWITLEQIQEIAGVGGVTGYEAGHEL